MSDTNSGDAPPAEAPAEPLFSVADVEQFTNEDAEAGRAIGKLLSALFLYTVVAMLIVMSWTRSALETRHKAGSSGAVATEPAH